MGVIAFPWVQIFSSLPTTEVMLLHVCVHHMRKRAAFLQLNLIVYNYQNTKNDVFTVIVLTWTLQSFGFSWLTEVLPRDNRAIDFSCLVLSCSRAQTALLGLESRMVGCKFPDASLIPGLTVKGVANTCRAKQEDASKTSLGLERINTRTEEHCQKSPDVAMSHGYRYWDINFSWPVDESYTPR